MAWWTHITFFGDRPENTNARLFKEQKSLGVLYRAFRQYVYDNFVSVLHVFLRILIYLYLGIAILTFFFPARVPHLFASLIDALSEPYLGALGIYVVVKEVERRNYARSRRSGLELLPILWFCFLVAASIAVYYSDAAKFGGIYRTVVTDALAVIIIRIGTILR